jgi:hypothetical protein
MPENAALATVVRFRELHPASDDLENACNGPLAQAEIKN